MPPSVPSVPDIDDTAKALEARFFDRAPEALLVVAPDGAILRANAAASRLLGCVPRGRIADIVAPQDRAALAALLAPLPADAAALATGAGEVLEADVSGPAGQTLRCELQVLDTDAASRVLRVSDLDDVDLGATGDQAFDRSPTGMAIVAPDGRFRRVNDALCALLGRARAELLTSDIVDVAADTGLAQDWAARTFADGLPPSVQLEARMRRGDGGEVIALVSATQVTSAAGRPLHYVCQYEDVTERVLAQEQLELNEAKLADAQQVARLGSWDWSVDDGEVTWSDELYRICGMRPDHGPRTNADLIDRLHPDDLARATRTIERAFRATSPWNMDCRIVRPDGDVRMLHARGEVVRGADGSVCAMYGTCQDITEARRVEDALRATEQLFRRAFDDAPIGMALVDLEGRWLRLNRAVSQMCGYSEAELRARSLDELGHPDDAEQDEPFIRELLAGRRRSYAIEKRMMHADGHVLHVLGHVSLMHGEGEQPLYYLIQLVDLSERRRMEAERRAGEDRLQAIVDNAPALIAVQDPDERLLLVNRRWEQLYGTDAAAALGHVAREVVRAAPDPEVERLDREVVRSGVPVEAQTSVVGADGVERHLHVVKFPLRDADGALTAVCTIGTDLTDRLRSERDRAQLERRLAQAERLESVGQLAGGVAHDFNNLLSVILSCVDFAERRLEPGHPVRDDVVEIQNAAERAAALTRQLLMFSRREVVQPEIFALGDLVSDLETLLARSLGETIELELTVAPGLPPVLADHARIEQVLVNLAVNARDAMPDGGRLRIDVRAEGDAVMVSVTDEGVGMAPDVAGRAFEPFFTTKAVGHGTGLGLATAHGIVTDSGGEITIESAPGEGTTVRFSLPAAQGSPPPVSAEPEVEDGPPASGRVLVVEDQDPVRRQVVRILQAQGYAVRDAASGDEALASWEPCDVLVTDIVMPGMSGQELARRAVEIDPQLSVVFMSGHTEDLVVLEGAREREIAFVQKPFTRASLLRTVADALGAADGSAAA